MKEREVGGGGGVHGLPRYVCTPTPVPSSDTLRPNPETRIPKSKFLKSEPKFGTRNPKPESETDTRSPTPCEGGTPRSIDSASVNLVVGSMEYISPRHK